MPNGNKSVGDRAVVWTDQPKKGTLALRRVAAAVVAVALLAMTVTVVGSVTGSVGIDTAAAGDGRSQDRGVDSIRSVAEADLAPTSDGTENGREDAGAPADFDPPVGPADEDPSSRRASRFVAGSNQRLLDSRGDGGPPPRPGTAHRIQVQAGLTAAALSISVMATEQAGSVLVDGRAGIVEAITIGEPGTTTTNLVFVPVVGDAISITSTAGGHLVVDLVGSFEPSGPTDRGRFVAVEPVEIASLETALEGRELDLDFTSGGGLPLDQASAVLVSIEADVGSEGGMIRLGPSADAYDQILMWDPAAAGNRQRRGLVLLEPTAERIGALRYDGGSELTVDVLGYFTNDRAEVDTAGLFVPSGPRLLVDGPIGPDEPLTFGLDGSPAAALITVGSRSGVPGQLGTIVLPAPEAEVVLRPSAPVEAVVTLLGVFLS